MINLCPFDRCQVEVKTHQEYFRTRRRITKIDPRRRRAPRPDPKASEDAEPTKAAADEPNGYDEREAEDDAEDIPAEPPRSTPIQV